MSDADEAHAEIATGAEAIEARAAEWLAHRVSDDWTEMQQAELNVWLMQSPAHRIAFLRLGSAWGHTYRLSVLRTPTREHAAVAAKSANWRLLGRSVAILAIVALLTSAVAIYLSAPRMEIFTTATGSHQTIRLADGSQIELNTDTILRASLNEVRRTIWLDRGEAYFQIRHDAARPFVVIAQGHRVLDIGTKFLVRRNTDRLEVAVVEGRVQFDTASDTPQARSTVLGQGDVIVASGNTTSVTREPPQRLANELSWRRGLLAFDNARLADVVAEFNRYNEQKIVIADPAINRLVIGGTFPTTDIDAFAELAQDVLGLRVEKRGDRTVISR
jgi:transmembrane sensor